MKGYFETGWSISFLSSLGEHRKLQGNIKHCIHFIITVCLILTLSTVTLADDITTDKACAGGARTVITGAVTGQKYCKSNIAALNWWNAFTWCDALNMPILGVME